MRLNDIGHAKRQTEGCIELLTAGQCLHIPPLARVCIVYIQPQTALLAAGLEPVASLQQILSIRKPAQPFISCLQNLLQKLDKNIPLE
ncbi:hypothetical protein D3C80_1854870 [compost metagenome]